MALRETESVSQDTIAETILLLEKQTVSAVWKYLAVVTGKYGTNIPFPISIIYGRLRRFCYKISSLLLQT